MRKSLLRRPSPALVVAFVALVVALGGTSYAAFSLPKNSVGSKQIKNGAVINSKLKKGAVTTGKIKNGTVTKSKINTSGLTVPNALQANNATTAGSATTATTATTATNVAGITRFRTTLAAGGTSFTDAAQVTLGTSGPLSLVGKCFVSGGVVTGSVFLSTTAAAESNIYDVSSSGEALSPGTDQDAEQTDASSTPPAVSMAGPYDGTFSAITNSGSNYLSGLASTVTGLNGASSCTFAGFTYSS